MGQLDHELPFNIGPMNGRDAPESGPRLKAWVDHQRSFGVSAALPAFLGAIFRRGGQPRDLAARCAPKKRPGRLS